MHLKLNPRTAGKLASLSALGAGALVAGMGEAEAAIIWHPVSAGVGFSSGFATRFTAQTASGAGFKFTTRQGFSAAPSYHSSATYKARRAIRFTGLTNAGGPLRFASSGGMLKLFAFGAKFGAPASTTSGRVASRSWFQKQAFRSFRHTTTFGPYGTRYQHTTGTNFTTQQYHSANPAGFSNEYALFRFVVSGQADYGWVGLSLVNDGVFGNPNGSGPDLTITGWAYDDSGAQIAAGDQGVPEPGTLPMTGLGALVLGAVGVRRWRAARAAKTA